MWRSSEKAPYFLSNIHTWKHVKHSMLGYHNYYLSWGLLLGHRIICILPEQTASPNTLMKPFSIANCIKLPNEHMLAHRSTRLQPWLRIIRIQSRPEMRGPLAVLQNEVQNCYSVLKNDNADEKNSFQCALSRPKEIGFWSKEREEIVWR